MTKRRKSKLLFVALLLLIIVLVVCVLASYISAPKHIINPGDYSQTVPAGQQEPGHDDQDPYWQGQQGPCLSEDCY